MGRCHVCAFWLAWVLPACVGGDTLSPSGEADAGNADASTADGVSGGASETATGGVLDAASGSAAGSPADPPACEETTKRAGDGILAVVDTADRACTRDEECILVKVAVSCSDHCLTASIHRQGEAAAYAEVARIEREHCRNADGDTRCSVEPVAPCDDPSTTSDIPRCTDGFCSSVSPGCGPDCTVGSDGVCHGDPACDGCPFVIEAAEGQACERPGQTCYGGYDPCGPWIECLSSDGSEPSRWQQVICL